MTTVKGVANNVSSATGLKWGTVVMGLFMLAFLLYIIGAGSIGKYKTLLLG